MMECRHVLIWKRNWLLPWLWDPLMNIANAYCHTYAFLQGVILFYFSLRYSSNTTLTLWWPCIKHVCLYTYLVFYKSVSYILFLTSHYPQLLTLLLTCCLSPSCLHLKLNSSAKNLLMMWLNYLICMITILKMNGM